MGENHANMDTQETERKRAPPPSLEEMEATIETAASASGGSQHHHKVVRRMLNECARVNDLDKALLLLGAYTTFDQEKVPQSLREKKCLQDDSKKSPITVTADICSVVLSICTEAASVFAPMTSPCLHGGIASYSAQVTKLDKDNTPVTLSVPLFPARTVTAMAGHTRREPVKTTIFEEELMAVVGTLFEMTKDIHEKALQKQSSRSQENGMASRKNSSTENIWSLFTRVYCILDQYEEALDVFRTMLKYGVEPRLRTYTPLIAALGTNGSALAADGLLRDLMRREDLYPSESNIGYVIFSYYQRALLYQDLELVPRDIPLEYVLHRKQTLDEYDLTWKWRCMELLHLAMDYHYIPSLAFHDTVSKALTLNISRTQDTWSASQATVGEEGFVQPTQEYLQSLDLTAEETKSLLDEVSTLASKNKRTERQFTEFQSWLRHQGSFDVIVDGANVAFFNQNFAGGGFHHLQVDDVVQHFLAENKRVLLVLHNKWLNYNTDTRTPAYKRPHQIPDTPAESECGAHNTVVITGDSVEARNPWKIRENESSSQRGHSSMSKKSRYIADCVKKWRELGILYECQRGNNDDWYWLYATLWSGKHCHVVTNDQMRDHHFQMLGPKEFLKWKERHQCFFHIQSFGSGFDCRRKVTFQFPSRFSHRMQPNQDNTAWYIPHPYDSKRWTCVWKTADPPIPPSSEL